MFTDLELALEKFERYRKQYNDYKHQSPVLNFLKSKIIDSYPSYNLEYFRGKNINNNIFLISPSIINNSAIFSIGDEKSFIGFLINHGDVYLINWHEPSKEILEYNLDNYAADTAKIASELSHKLNKKVNLIGYCLGGNFALAAAIISSEKIKSLMLFATPWDYSYLQPYKTIVKKLEFEKTIAFFDFVPSLYMQILFFFTDLNKSFYKFFKKIELLPQKNKNIFYDVEKWLYTGNNITKAAYNQLMLEFVEQNVTMNNAWYVGKNLIDLEKIKIPVLSVSGIKDNIVASQSVKPLHNKLINCKAIKMDTGHIGFFIGKKKEMLFKKIDNWMRGLNE